MEAERPQNIEDLPDELLEEIIRRLDMKVRVKSLLVNKRWSRVMPFADRQGRLDLGTLPFRFLRVESAHLTAALKTILPRVGEALKSLSFGSHHLAPDHFDIAANNCSNLSAIDLPAVTLSRPEDFNFEAMERMRNLKSLKIEDTFTDDWPTDEDGAVRFAADLSSVLNTLQLDEFSYYSFHVPVTLVAPKLTRLKLLHTWNFTSLQLMQICRCSPNLTHMWLWKCVDLADFTPIGLLSNLVELNLRYSRVNHDHMEAIARSCSQLRSVNLLNCADLTQFDWVHHVPSLNEIHLSNVDATWDWIPQKWAIEEIHIDSHLTGAELLSLSAKTLELKRLRLDHPRVDENVAVSLADRWDRLEEITLAGNNVNSSSVAHLGRRTNLRRLDVRNCIRIDLSCVCDDLAGYRQRQGICTPLNIVVFGDRIEISILDAIRLGEDLRKVNVRLVGE